MRRNEIAVSIRLAIKDTEQELDRRVSAGEDSLVSGIRILDELERTIDDIDNQRLRQVLRGLIDRLDEHRATVGAALADISTYELWDPLRALAIDVQDKL